MVKLDHNRLGQAVKLFVAFGEQAGFYADGVGAALVIDQRNTDGCAGVAVVADLVVRLMPLTRCHSLAGGHLILGVLPQALLDLAVISGDERRSNGDYSLAPVTTGIVASLLRLCSSTTTGCRWLPNAGDEVELEDGCPYCSMRA